MNLKLNDKIPRNQSFVSGLKIQKQKEEETESEYSPQNCKKDSVSIQLRFNYHENRLEYVAFRIDCRNRMGSIPPKMET
ncbi:MAG: hypothetical protein HUJ55_07390 [Ileibacterium sp.]|nr:hypothetical protein [Ileibacterium sp.]